MDVLGTIAAFLVILVVLILVHELGHFIAAKRAGITVEEFGVGFPPRLASIEWHGTRYSLNAIPLGGFVRMLGENGDLEVQRLRERGLSPAAIERAMEGAFNRRPVWVRVLVLLAGVAMNFLLAGILFSVMSVMPVMQGRGPLSVMTVEAGTPAASAGLEVGDQITAADGQTFEVSTDLTAYIRSHAGEPVTLSIDRAGATREITVVPRDPATLKPGEGAVGFTYRAARYVEQPSSVSGPLDAALNGFGLTAELAVNIPGALAGAVGGLIGLSPSAPAAMGPIGIAQETGRVLQEPIAYQLGFIGLLSVNLAVLNVLPFPPLDGGRILVVLIEAVRRRRLPMEREALIYLAGFLVLIFLVFLISIQDIQRLIQG